MLLVYVTHQDEIEAKKMVMHLLEKRLIACANLFPIESMYWWKGKVENAKEVVSLLKTTPENWTALKQEIEATHPYEAPCIIRVEGEAANAAYAQWLAEETKR